MITEDQLLKKIRLLINENEEDCEMSLISEDTRSLDKHIKSLLPESVLFVQMNKIQGVLNSKSMDNISEFVSFNNDGCVTVALPDDYVRLVSLKLKDWKRACTKTVPTGSLIEKYQADKYMCAGVFSPVCVECTDMLNKSLLILYPSSRSSEPVIEHFVYEAMYNGSDGISGGDEMLVKAVTYHCAALLYNVFEKPDTANAFWGIATSLCNNQK